MLRQLKQAVDSFIREKFLVLVPFAMPLGEQHGGKRKTLDFAVMELAKREKGFVIHFIRH